MQHQKNKHLHRRQRGAPPPVADADADAASSVVVSLASPVPSPAPPGGGRGSKDRAAEDDPDEDDGGTRPLSACSTTCLSTYLGSDCRTVSCMCNNPELANANTCIAAACPLRDRGVFLTNIQAWCGNAQAVALLTPAASVPSSSIAPSRVRSSPELSSSIISTSSSVPSTLSESIIALSASSIASEMSSSAVTSSSTRRPATTRTTTIPTTIERSVQISSETGRVNPKLTDADLASSAENGNNPDGGTDEKKGGASGGTIAGIVLGMLLAFVLIGLSAWYVRRSLLGRNKKGKEFLRSSDPGDWVNNDIITSSAHDNDSPASKRGSAGIGEDLDEKDGGIYGEGNRIEKTMQERHGSLVSAQAIHPGIGAYARDLPPHPPPSSTASEFGFYPNIGNSNIRQSQRQYEDMHASLAYPSHIGVSPSSPYHTHPQHYPQAYYPQSQFVTPHTSMNSMNIDPPGSAGVVSTMANLSYQHSPQGKDYPESITMTPETIHAINGGGSNANAGLPNDTNASHIGRHQSIPFIIPAALQAAGANMSDSTGKRESLQPRQPYVRYSQNQHLYSGSVGGDVPRPLTIGGQVNRSSMSSATTGSVPPAKASSQDRMTLHLAQGIPLPTSPASGNASLPMPLPGMVAESKRNSIVQPAVIKQEVGLVKGEDTVDNAGVEKENSKKGMAVAAENPFLDVGEDEKQQDMKRESFEGLAYLSS